MSDYPAPQPGPQPGPEGPYPSSPGDTPYPPPGMYTGGSPSGEMVPYGQTAQTGGWPQLPVPAGGQPLTSIGDISITQTTVITPTGRCPIRGTVWTCTDMTQVQSSIPAIAIVLCILFFCFGLGLLFLLMKEHKVSGFVQVTVQGEGVYHSTMIPAYSRDTAPQIMQQVNYARSLAAMA